MKMILFATTALLIGVSAASAADIAAHTYTKAPPMAVAATNWSGFYLGGFGGYGWSNSLTAGVPGGGAVTVSSDDLTGGFGGGTIGYNWQAPGSQFVWGLEVDGAGSAIRDSATTLGVTATDELNAFGSVTGRVGVAFDTMLLYAKGGYGWGNNRLSFSGLGGSFSEEKLHSGWTVGGGLEWMFAPYWSAKVEYQYYDFNTESYLAVPLPPGVDFGASFHTVKVGINYHFN